MSDPAGWEYGVPNYATRDDEREGYRIEIAARIALKRKERPELTEAQAYRLIRERDRAFAEKLLAPSDGADALSVRCPWCHAAEHRPCQIPNVHGETRTTLRNPHPQRIEAVST